MTYTFRQELKALMEKYNATISWGCGEHSDTSGIYGECMLLDSTDGLEEIDGDEINTKNLE